MLIKRNEMITEEKEKLRDGVGKASVCTLVNCENEKNIRYLSQITLEPGSTVGKHNHVNETEYFVFLSGSGIVDDDGKEEQVNAGDVIITGKGAYHSVNNTGSVPLVFIGVIVTY